MMTTSHPLVTDYLQRLQQVAAERLPADRAAELVADLRDDLRERLPDGAGEAEVRNALERLGSPEDIVAAAGGVAPAVVAPAPSNRLEIAALILLVASVVLTVIWPLALLLLSIGFVLTMMSRRWSTADKVLASITYVGLGPLAIGIAGLMAFANLVPMSCVPTGNETTCEAPSSPYDWVPITLLVLGLALHLYTAVRLARHTRLDHVAPA